MFFVLGIECLFKNDNQNKKRGIKAYFGNNKTNYLFHYEQSCFAQEMFQSSKML